MDDRAAATNRSADKRWALRLAASDGRLVDGAGDLSAIVPFSEPERPMEVFFEGLSEAQQQAALKAFPGGRRFHLASP